MGDSNFCYLSRVHLIKPTNMATTDFKVGSKVRLSVNAGFVPSMVITQIKESGLIICTWFHATSGEFKTVELPPEALVKEL